MKRHDVYTAIDERRAFQDTKWHGYPVASPSDEIRLIRTILDDADTKWHASKDDVVDGRRVNVHDLEAISMVAAVAVRCMERWGAPPIPKVVEDC